MNTYSKITANVFGAKGPEKHKKGEIITVTTRHGKEHRGIVFNCIGQDREGNYYHSIVREDGYNFQERAKGKAERLAGWAENAQKRSDKHWEDSKEGRDFLSLGEPIKVGHHSESRHRNLIERNNNRMRKSVEEQSKVEEYIQRVEYWEKRAQDINLSMPESLEYYEFELEKAVAHHTGIKEGTIPKDHSYSLTYAKKRVNEITKKLVWAKRLWGGEPLF